MKTPNTQELSSLDQLLLDPAFPMIATVFVCLILIALFLLAIYLLKDSQKMNQYEQNEENFRKKHYPKTQKNE